jgi:hypothetical protein
VKPERKFVEVGRCDSCGCAIDKDGHGHHSAVDCKYMREEEKAEVFVWDSKKLLALIEYAKQNANAGGHNCDAGIILDCFMEEYEKEQPKGEKQ